MINRYFHNIYIILLSLFKQIKIKTKQLLIFIFYSQFDFLFIKIELEIGNLSQLNGFKPLEDRISNRIGISELDVSQLIKYIVHSLIMLKGDWNSTIDDF